MNSEIIFDAITDIDESLIIEARQHRFMKKSKIVPFVACAAATVAIVLAVGFLRSFLFSSHMITPEYTLPLPEETLSSFAGNNKTEDEETLSSFTGNNETEDENTVNSSENTTAHEDISHMPEENTSLSSEEEPRSEYEEATTGMSVVLPSDNDHSPSNKVTIKPQTLSTASYPEMAKYPNSVMQYGPLFDSMYTAWKDDIKEVQKIEVNTDNVTDFSADITEKFLAVADDKNKAVSPLNIYMALCLLAECTDNNSRQQILSLLGADSIEALREQAEKLWRKNYRDDGYMKSILANSLWLNNSIKYKSGLLDTLSEKYYTSVFYGTTGTDSYNKMLNNWINDNTGNQLSPDIKMSEEAVFSIVSTLLYQTKWTNEFDKNTVEKGEFHSPSGSRECEFLTREENRKYYWGENFSAIGLGLDIGGQMWFFLPDEDYDADRIFADGEIRDLLELSSVTRETEYKNSKDLIVNMKIPKFDITADTDLKNGLSELGITDVMNPLTADFSPLAQNFYGIYADSFRHSMRVKIDEEGVSAAAYTAIIGAGSTAPPDERVDFILDRPFAFAVTLDNKTILFAGVVNQP